LVTLRWMATGVTLLLIILAQRLIPGNLPLVPLLLTVAGLVVINLVYTWYGKRNPPTTLNREMVFVRMQIILDLVLLTGLIHFSGGIENPFYLFYIFHIIIASTIFEHRREPFIVTATAVILFSSLVFAEYFGWVEHYSIFGTSYSTVSVFASLGAFYVMTVASAYLGVTLVARHLKVKNLITEKNHQLEASSKSKMTFFRYVSHELKSPIVAVQSYISVVLDLPHNPLNEQSRDLLSRARNRTEQMLDIIKDLLELSYDRNVDQEMTTDMVPPGNYLQEIIESERPKAQLKHIDIEVNIRAEKNNFKLDRFLLEKIVSNLLSNAIRYTRSGGRIEISTNQNDKYWQFRIADNGIGISPEDQEHIFKEFYRGKNARDTEAIGTGLGLSIVKKFMDQLNGQIELTSQIDKGTEITVTIPRIADEN